MNKFVGHTKKQQYYSLNFSSAIIDAELSQNKQKNVISTRPGPLDGFWVAFLKNIVILW